ncbi:hypothetical protein EJ08DRAFT_524473 [Tothia fuscella]|uniref:Transmembrane protein n=1 Tax=Tothia fuscella TaxID=1048955 RepID=A0A9P4NH89_9PEZI|nr:hypothetical protein EJ08DRAFT_524473 [Tothia fuscella]
MKDQLQELRAQLSNEEILAKYVTNTQYCLNQHKIILSIQEQNLKLCMDLCRTNPEKHPRLFRPLPLCPEVNDLSYAGDINRNHRSILQLSRTLIAFRTELLELFKDITSTVTILESGRQIEEASSVNKLTELAFFFIPMGFSASLYGMQIKEFSDKVHLRTFVMTAFIAVSSSYLLRGTLRSRLISKMKKYLTSSVRRTANLDSNASIPATTLCEWIWKNKSARLCLSHVLIILVFAMAGLVPIWTSVPLSRLGLGVWMIDFLGLLEIAYLFSLDSLRAWKRRHLYRQTRFEHTFPPLFTLFTHLHRYASFVPCALMFFVFFRLRWLAYSLIVYPAIIPLWLVSEISTDVKVGLTVLVDVYATFVVYIAVLIYALEPIY